MDKKEIIDLRPLLRMKDLLKKALQNVEDELDEMAAVQAFEVSYLEDPEVWFNFGKERNLTSHTYQEDILTAIYNLLPNFLQEFEKLITKLQEKNF
ncbi:4820_t:CDS:2 [Funneliformis geosporum]|uniref:15861_t:CDS:1 n=1 Tax=Funneliformis geosporum TaxID=1117311 RepID=A0A9W4SEW3_9GLOM|nr:15861_t:CDS:2 [Funneliformis geosporum]CAI2177702.1 4820_t:CDS:2 [Funneliformis geosporum]